MPCIANPFGFEERELKGIVSQSNTSFEHPLEAKSV